MDRVLILLFLIVNVLWKLAGILAFVTLVAAAVEYLPWSAPVGWFVVMLILAAIRLGLAALVGRMMDTD
jgi:hypothetical protein